MNSFDILIAAAHYGVIFPGIFICIVPVADWIVVSQKKLYPVLIPVMIAICLILGCLESRGTYYTNLFFFPLLLLCLIAYFIVVHIGNLKLLYLFLCATATLSVGCIISNYIIAYTVPDSNVHDSSIPGLILQYAISFIIMFFFIVIKDKLKWIFENVNLPFFWRLAWIIPALITFCNIFAIFMIWKCFKIIRSNYYIICQSNPLPIIHSTVIDWQTIFSIRRWIAKHMHVSTNDKPFHLYPPFSIRYFHFRHFRKC